MSDVENIDQAEAIQKYQPDIVLTSWMPRNVDFTTDFRRSPDVQEYILIGYTE